MNPFSRTIINGVLDRGRSLPSKYRLFYSRTPNNWLDVGWEGDFGWDSELSTWSVPRTVTDWAGTTRDMFTILGEGLFFDSTGNSLSVTGTQILAWSGINRWQILFSLKKGLAIYDQSAPSSTIRNAHRYYRSAYEDLGSGDFDLFYSSTDGLLARSGIISWPGTPTITADGVTPGAGPSFTDVIIWSDGAKLYIKMKMLKSSTGITGDEQVFGPLYVRNGYLVANDGANTAIYATSWDVDDVVAAVIEIWEDGAMRVGRI